MRSTAFEIDGVAYDYESSFEFEGASYPKSEYFTAGDRLYDFATYFCLNDTAYAHADYFLLGDTAYDRAEWFEHDGAAYRHSEHYVAHDRLYEIKGITLGGKTFMSDVTELELRDCGITDISVLADCGKLEKLDLGSEWDGTGNTNRIEDISALSELYGLKYLDLAANKISDLVPLAKLVGLEYLNLARNSIIDLAPLSDLSNLTHLDISYVFISDKWYEKLDITPISGMKMLTYLNISHNAIGVRIEALSELRNLEYLNMDMISNFGTIEKVDAFGSAYIEGLDITPLKELTKLSELHIDTIMSNDYSALSCLKNLRKLHMSSVNDFSFLLNLTELTHLDIDRVGGKPVDISPLYELQKLELLIAPNNLNDEEASDLINALPECRIIFYAEQQNGIEYW